MRYVSFLLFLSFFVAKSLSSDLDKIKENLRSKDPERIALAINALFDMDGYEEAKAKSLGFIFHSNKKVKEAAVLGIFRRTENLHILIDHGKQFNENLAAFYSIHVITIRAESFDPQKKQHNFNNNNMETRVIGDLFSFRYYDYFGTLKLGRDGNFHGKINIIRDGRRFSLPGSLMFADYKPLKAKIAEGRRN